MVGWGDGELRLIHWGMELSYHLCPLGFKHIGVKIGGDETEVNLTGRMFPPSSLIPTVPLVFIMSEIGRHRGIVEIGIGFTVFDIDGEMVDICAPIWNTPNGNHGGTRQEVRQPGQNLVR